MVRDTEDDTQLTPVGPRPREDAPATEAIGRFVVLEKLGEGGMGAVYAARDPLLNRKVAIKLLRRELAGDAHAARMVQEAQSLARLSHPNVVHVHEFGIADGRMFLAMEHIEGDALSDVLREPRPWERVLELFLAAGEGLSAAHAAGLIHRDFKPQNVMLGKDGRVRVLDFGLARETGDDEPTQPATPAPSAASSRLTHAGAVMGTPRYMSPEQSAGKSCDARTDQFSFCVSLWEGLYGDVPFKAREAGSNDVTAEVKTEPSWVPPEGRPVNKEVPAYVHRALLRGLSLEREQRFPSMTALLEALRRPTRRYPLWLVYALAVVTALIVVAAVAARYQARTPRGWWGRHRSACNPVRVDSALQEARKPGGPLSEGKKDAGVYLSACLALAGRFDEAGPLAAALPDDERALAAHLFYLLAAPRDEQPKARLSGGQRDLMALALEHSRPPLEEHARAAYYLAMAEFDDGEFERAREHLEIFLKLHPADDAWRRAALEALNAPRE